MMRPCPCLRITGSTRRVSSYQPKKLVSNSRRTLSVDTSSKAPGWL